MRFEPCSFFSGMAVGSVIINLVFQLLKIHHESSLKPFEEHWEEIRKELKSDKEQFRR